MLSKKCILFVRKYIFIILIVFIFIVVRLVHLPESIGFGSDEGRDFLVTWNIFQNKDLTLIGPPSEFTINGRQFFFGPAPYYVILPALIIGNWDPLFVSNYLIIINCFVLLFILLVIDKYIKDRWILYLFSVFYTFTPLFVKYTQSYWNPYFMLPTSVLLLSFLILSKYTRSKSNIIKVVIGFLFGIGMQFHYSFIFAVVMSMVWLMVNKKLNLVSVVSIILGFILGFFPLILFELRNHFYNLNTLYLVLRFSNEIHNSFSLRLFYFISLFPFIIFLLSFFLSKILRTKKFILYLFLIIYILWSLGIVVSVAKNELSYPTLKKITEMIIQDHPSNFNIVDQLTRDNRANALRYLLTVQGFAPRDIDEYQSVKSLYIYSKESLEKLLASPVYEIKSFLPFRKAGFSKIEKGINLYKLMK